MVKIGTLGYVLIAVGLLLVIPNLGMRPVYAEDRETATYFECSFSKVYPPEFDFNEEWVRYEPCRYQCERGVWHWTTMGSKWGSMRLVSDPTDASHTCLEMILNAKGERPLNNNQHVKLYECQGREAENYAEPYPTLKEAYYYMQYWFPSDFKVDSWRLIWQYCGEEGVYGNPDHTFHPQMALTFGRNYLYLQNDRYYYKDRQARSFQLIRNTDLPKERWVPIVVYVKQGSAYQSLDGTVVIWIDGVKVFERHNLPTSTFSRTPYVIWGIGNYGSPREAYGQSILIKDVVVSSGEPSSSPSPTGTTYRVTYECLDPLPQFIKGTRGYSKTLYIDVKDYGSSVSAAEAIVELYDTEFVDEGNVYVNGKGPIDLPLTGNARSKTFNINIPVSYLVDGVNKFEFVYPGPGSSWGYEVNAFDLTIEFTT